MGKNVAMVLGVLLLGFLTFVATRPANYHVQRSIVIKAPSEAAFAAISDLRAFTTWSPWDKRDPAMKKTFSDKTSGVGASYAWQGNKDVGAGRMTITESVAPTHVRHRLEFLEPFASVAKTGFDLVPAGPGELRASWSMEGRNDFIGKAFAVFRNMDEMIGRSDLLDIRKAIEFYKARGLDFSKIFHRPDMGSPSGTQTGAVASPGWDGRRGASTDAPDRIRFKWTRGARTNGP